MSHYLACRIGQEWYGISIEAVSEVLHILALRHVPKSNLAGVMTLRDKVMPVIDLREYLGIENYSFELDTPIVALQLFEKFMGVIVDEADDVLVINNEDIQAYSNGLVTGMARMGDRLLFIINLQDLVAHYLETQSNEG